MQAIKVEHYLKRAADFSYVVLLLRGDASHRYSSALLAIHAAISYSDALRIGLGDTKLGRDDHNRAAEALKEILPVGSLSDETGLGHLRYLLSNKLRDGSMTASEGIQMGRAKNAVLEFLENRLIVPKIYLDADWGGQNVEVLAIERDGVGDVHAVLLFGCDTAGDPEEFGSYWIAAMNPLIDRFQ